MNTQRPHGSAPYHKRAHPRQHLPRPGCSHTAGAAPNNNKAPSPQPPPCLRAPRIQVTAWATWAGGSQGTAARGSD